MFKRRDSSHGLPTYNYTYDHNEGLIAVSHKKTYKYGFINQDDDLVIPYKYDYADSLYKKRALVCLNKKWGYIDITGEEVIPLKYDYACPFTKAGLAGVTLNGESGFIDINDNIIIPFEYEEVDDPYKYGNIGLGPVKKNGKWGFIDKHENIIVPFKYDGTYQLGPLTSVCIGGEYREKSKKGIIDSTGKEIIPLIYDWIACCSNEDILRVDLDDKMGYIDSHSGKKIVPVEYEWGVCFEDGYAILKKNGKHALCCINGGFKKLTPFIYDWIDYTGDENSKVSLNGKTSYIDKQGKEI